VIADFYRLADVMLLPSLEEGFGIPILEAGLAGVPVFCADIPPLRELGGKSAAYFSLQANPHDVAALIAHKMVPDNAFNLRLEVKLGYTWESIYKDNIRPLLKYPGS